MRFDIKKIATAWAKSWNPTEDELLLAQKRLEVCNACEMSRMSLLKISSCGACGCPLSKKVFTADYNDCPVGKWEEVDGKYFDLTKIKTKNTII